MEEKETTTEFNDVTKETAATILRKKRESTTLTREQFIRLEKLGKIADRYLNIKSNAVPMTQEHFRILLGIGSYQQYSTYEKARVDWRKSQYAAKILEVLGFSAQERIGLGLLSNNLSLIENRYSTNSPEHQAAIDQLAMDIRAETQRGVVMPVFATGFGPSFQDEKPEGEMTVEPELLARYPNLMLNRIHGKCLEPEYPDGWIAYVLPEPSLASQGSPVLVWLSGNGRVVKYLVQSREDGNHVLFQPNPPQGEGQIIQAPIGSIIIGVVIDVRKGSSRKASLRSMYKALEAERPDLIGDEDNGGSSDD